MKTCFKCRKELPRSQFYRHAQMADGLLGKCKECTKSDTKKYRSENREYCHSYEKERSSSPERKAAVRQTSTRWKMEYPERKRAIAKLNKAVISGKVKKYPCFVCGEEKVDGHHPHYGSPLDVVWLCRSHHRELHAMHDLMIKQDLNYRGKRHGSL